MHNNKTIWIINQYAGSIEHGMEYRHYYLAKEFINLGYKVVIISGSYSHLYNKKPEIKNTFTFEEIEGIKYCWVKIPKYKKSISIARFYNMLVFALKLKFLPINKLEKPEAIIVSSPSLFPITTAKKWAKKLNSKLFFEVRDIWPLTLQEVGGLNKKHPLSLILSYYENIGYKKSDKIISLLPDAYKHYKNFGIEASKVEYIPNGIFINEGINEPLLPSIKELIPNNKLIIGYLGTIGKSNALDHFIKAVNLLKDNKEIFFIFVGNGAEKENLKSLTISENVKWIDVIDKKYVQSMLQLFDACYIGLPNIKLYEMGISANKIFDYMYAAKPIIHTNNSSNNLVKMANCGFSISPENPQEIVNAIMELYNLSVEERNKMGENGKKYVLENHTYSQLAKKYIDCINL